MGKITRKAGAVKSAVLEQLPLGEYRVLISDTRRSVANQLDMWRYQKQQQTEQAKVKIMSIKATAEIVKITPRQATAYLERLMPGQRPMRQAWVDALAEDMRNGDYRLSSDAILLVKGLLANGQHRMWAVVESDTTQPFILMSSDDDELYKVIDIGNRRSIGDSAMVSNASAAAAAGRLILGYNKKSLTMFAYKTKIPRLELVEWLQDNDARLQDVVKLVSTLFHAGQNILPKSCATALMFLVGKEHSEAATAFVRHVVVGDEPTGPAFALRNRLLKMKLQTAKYPTQYYFALLAKGFNAALRGQAGGNLRIQDNEEFPELAVID